MVAISMHAVQASLHLSTLLSSTTISSNPTHPSSVSSSFTQHVFDATTTSSQQHVTSLASSPALSSTLTAGEHDKEVTHMEPDKLASQQPLTNTNDIPTRDIPQYVFDYAPLLHLYSGEQFWPGDIAEHLLHTAPFLDYTPLDLGNEELNLSNLNDLNAYGRRVFLTSDDNVEDRPTWLSGRHNIPEFAKICNSTRREEGEICNAKGRPAQDNEAGRSSAPVTLVVVPKGDGVIDAFWWFFYSYNLGNKVFNIRFGNHIGDWEHINMRFRHGEPEAIFFSQHSFGDAYNYSAVEKVGKRPVGYIATGSHALYGHPGVHRYVLPWGLLHDTTDDGPLWDPSLNTYSYIYHANADRLYPASQTPDAPTQWFYFNGRWGDKIYPLSDKRQYQLAGQYHYITGPPGPRFHNLGRKEICPGGRPCIIKNTLVNGLKWRLQLHEGELVIAPCVLVVAIAFMAFALTLIGFLEGGRRHQAIAI